MNFSFFSKLNNLEHGHSCTNYQTPTGWPKKTTTVDERNILTAMKKKPKTTFSDITNKVYMTGMKVSQSTV